ncbi:MAG: NAD(P)(+) transhydrogenase (Re/Si-specific) subunit beta [Leptospiraceae bacterium]|nr:NAD(P)(+) transhydrogenase (Re/Si-specific) subunit beta [Leptospiraceae bacterium]
MIQKSVIEILYLFSAFLFISGLKIIGTTKHSRKGNWISAIGMLLAIIGSLMDERVNNLSWIFSAIIVGSVLGILSARKVRMNSIPLMVSFLNGMGGASAATIGAFQYMNHPGFTYGAVVDNTSLAILLSIISGTMSFSGSVITFGKIKGWVTEKSVFYPLQKTLNVSLLFIIGGISLFILIREGVDSELVILLSILSFLYGFLLILPVKGNNIPVAISILNSMTGFSTLMIGFVFENLILIMGGIIVWSAGILLAFHMSKALNKPLSTVFFQTRETNKSLVKSERGLIAKEISLIDAAILIGYAKRIIVVPGYGFGVSQAQFVCQELDHLLTARGIEVYYAIHPIAGRMPGHMNVLLAEADIPYKRFLELEEANQQFSITDIALVIGANDIINPRAIKDKKSPLYGMPILDVSEAKNIIILKKGADSGYSGEENPIFFHEKSSVILGDAKHNLNHIVKEIIEN